MQATKPKRMIKIFRWRVSLMAIYRALIMLMLLISLLLPWAQMKVSFIRTSTINAVEGYIQLQVYPIGMVRNESVLDKYDLAGNKVSEYLLDEYFSISIIYGLCVIILILLNLLFLISEFRPIQFVLGNYRRIELISTLLGLALLVVSIYTINIVPVDKTNVGALKASLWKGAKDLINIYRNTKDVYNIDWGLGLVLFFVCVLSNLIVWFDRYILLEKYNLSSWWRLRGHLALLGAVFAILPMAESIVPPGVFGSFKTRYYVWSSLFLTSITLGGTSPKTLILPSIGALFMVLILAVWSLTSFIISAKSLPARYLMSATPFISLTLPDEELARRHKMLPVVSEWHRVIGLKLSVLAFVMVALIYMFLVHGFGFGQGSIVIKIEGEGGIFRTTFSAGLLLIVILVQFFLMFKPTR